MTLGDLVTWIIAIGVVVFMVYIILKYLLKIVGLFIKR